MGWILKSSVVVGSSNSNGITTGAINTAGANLIVISTSDYNAADPATLTDSKGNTWTKLTTRESPFYGRNAIYYCYNPTVGSGHTFTFAQVGGFPSLSVVAYYGSVASPFDVENGNANLSSVTIATGSITPTRSGSLIVAGVCGNHTGGTFTINSGFTVQGQVAAAANACIGNAIATYVQPIAAAINPTWTASGVLNGMSATIASFKGIPQTGMMGAV